MRLPELPLHELASRCQIIWISGVRWTDIGADRTISKKERRRAQNTVVPFHRPGRSRRLSETGDDSDLGSSGRGTCTGLSETDQMVQHFSLFSIRETTEGPAPGILSN